MTDSTWIARAGGGVPSNLQKQAELTCGRTMALGLRVGLGFAAPDRVTATVPVAPPSHFGCSGATGLKPGSAAGLMYLGVTVGFCNVGGLVISNDQGQAARRPAASAPLGPWS